MFETLYEDDALYVREKDGRYYVETAGLGGEQILWNANADELIGFLESLMVSCGKALEELR